MKPLIECCEQNLAKGGMLILEDAFIAENSESVTYSCMHDCALCAQTFYVLFEGEKVTGATPQELITAIQQAIKQWQIMMN